MQSLKSTVLWIKVNSSLVSLLQVVTNVQESRSSEGVTKVANFGIGSNGTSEPVVGDAHCWNALSLAHVFEAGLAEDGDLMHNEIWLSVWVWAWEKI